MATANIAYCRGLIVAGANDGGQRRVSAQGFGQPLYNAAGSSRLCSNVEITTAAKIAIPAEAMNAEALIRIGMVTGGAYVITGMESDTNIAVGQGIHIGERDVDALEIGMTPAGERHTHLLVIADA
jgi:hypothetical protein